MQTTGSRRRNFLAGAFLLFTVLNGSGAAVAARAPLSNVPQLLDQAESLRARDNARFVELLQELESHVTELSDKQKWRLHYLQGWQAAYNGQEEKARTLLESVLKQASDSDLKIRATSVLIHVLGVGHHYEEAFEYLDKALDDLPQASDKEARARILGEASQLLSEAGQYDLAAGYAEQIIAEYPTGRHNCLGHMYELHARIRAGQTKIANETFQQSITPCLAVGEKLAADILRKDMAALALQQGKSDEALSLLQANYEEVRTLNYSELTADFNILLAQAYWKKGETSLAQKYATVAVDAASKSDLIEPLVKGYQLLYQIERQYGNLREALAYHEKYVTADKEHLDDTREKALAYQIIKQQIEAKKVELGELNKQNQILQLQQALDHKAVETSRLYIALLLTVLASIAFWLYRLKRSQLRFMRLARRDGLTGIFNRQHFVEEAEQALRYVAKSQRGASLILIDLDHFKNINDTYGHIAGDHALRRAVLICQQHLHSSDVFGRIGGEEFGILLPECTLIQALERAERIRMAMQAQPDAETEHVPLTASFGIASTAHYGYDLRRLLIAADSALYRAKRDGRNRVVVSMDNQASSSAASDTRAQRDKLNDAPPYMDASE
ncbi:MAG: diguanylate cyclase [Dyella sp.]|uniref:diguanylate cyclase n=1 Tax=Dyella sp. TaxID=1869338 RepID=UPI003F8120CE